MGSFEAECYRLSQIADPEGAAIRDWDKQEGQALKVVSEEITKLFETQDQLDVTIKFEKEQKESMMVVYSRGRTECLIAFTLKPNGANVNIWPFSNQATRFKVEKNPKVTAMNGGWGREELGEYFMSIFSNLK